MRQNIFSLNKFPRSSAFPRKVRISTTKKTWPMSFFSRKNNQINRLWLKTWEATIRQSTLGPFPAEYFAAAEIIQGETCQLPQLRWQPSNLFCFSYFYLFFSKNVNCDHQQVQGPSQEVHSDMSSQFLNFFPLIIFCGFFLLAWTFWKFWRGNRVMAIRMVCRLLPVLRVLKSWNVDFQLKKLSLSLNEQLTCFGNSDEDPSIYRAESFDLNWRHREPEQAEWKSSPDQQDETHW